MRTIRKHDRPARLAVPALALALAGALAACAAEEPGNHATPTRPAPTPDLPADAAVLLGLDATDSSVKQLGQASVRIDITNLEGGQVEVTSGLDGQPALDFPAFVATGSYPRAVVRVVNAGPEDQLNPGTRNFAWGADFKLDEESYGSPVDNGDNLMQRGTSSYPVFFKAELDGHRPACTVKGDAGILIVRAVTQVLPGRWYRLRCERTGDELAVHVTPLEGDGERYARRVRGPIGAVDQADPGTPLSVGGKIGADGKPIKDATDQFNGLVMNPVLYFM